MTDFSNKCKILSEFYIVYKDDDNLKDFIDFNDIGLPMAFLSHEGLVKINTEGERYIEETWNVLLASLNVEDTGFEDIDQLMTAADKDSDTPPGT